jgi:hypothetical protein
VRELSPDEARRFLHKGVRTRELAVVRRDGPPLVVPIWFLLDEEGNLVLTTWDRSAKGHALRRDPRVSICVDEEVPPDAYVRVDGPRRSARTAPPCVSGPPASPPGTWARSSRPPTGAAAASPASSWSG